MWSTTIKSAAPKISASWSQLRKRNSQRVSCVWQSEQNQTRMDKPLEAQLCSPSLLIPEWIRAKSQVLQQVKKLLETAWMLSKCISRSTCRLKLCQQPRLPLIKSMMSSMLIESSQERRRSLKPSTRVTCPWQQLMSKAPTSMTPWVQWTSWIRITILKLSKELLS